MTFIQDRIVPVKQHLYCNNCELCHQIDGISSHSKSLIKRSRPMVTKITARVIQSPSNDKLGIENIKDAFTETLEIGELILDITKDFSYSKLFPLGIRLAQFKAVLPIFKKALQEFTDLDQTEINDLGEHFKAEWNIENDQLEAVIERGIDLIIQTYNHICTLVDLYQEWELYIPELKDIFGLGSKKGKENIPVLRRRVA